MENNLTLSQVPNPLTPMAFLPASLADQFQASGYVIIGTVGVSDRVDHLFIIKCTLKGFNIGFCMGFSFVDTRRMGDSPQKLFEHSNFTVSCISVSVIFLNPLRYSSQDLA